jgi:very-short-patch-repair endonuclease
MTRAERRLWIRLRQNNLEGFHFRRQQIIEGFIVDFYCHEAALVIEVDGGVHARNRNADRERDAILSAMGFRILRFFNDEVINHVDDILRRILVACRTDLTPPPLSFPSSPSLKGRGGGGRGWRG